MELNRQSTSDPTGPEDIPAWMDALSSWLDTRFRIPGTNWRFGLDGLLGLIPVAGDAGSGLLSVFILARARALGVRKRVLLRMAAYVLIDCMVGMIPVAGDLFDFGYKANKKSIDLLRKELKQRPAQ